jgi:hypothetical protein
MAASVFRRNVTVSLNIAEPQDPPTWSGSFPSDEVLATIRQLDLASGDYHVKTGLFATELFCMVHEGPLPLVGAYSKDMWNAVLTELKGVIEEVEMREGEGVVDGAYAAFFPKSVVGIVRSSVKAPGSAALAEWLSLFGGHPLYLAALPKADALAGLQRPPEDINGVTFRVKKSLLTRIRAVRPDVASIIESASQVGGSTKVGFTLATAHRKERANWWPPVRAVINDLAEAQLLAEFEAASVSLYNRQNVNLKDAYVTAKQPVQIQNTKRIGPVHAAEALVGAYRDLEATLINPSVEAWRKRHTAVHQTGPDADTLTEGDSGVG